MSLAVRLLCWTRDGDGAAALRRTAGAGESLPTLSLPRGRDGSQWEDTVSPREGEATNKSS